MSLGFRVEGLGLKLKQCLMNTPVLLLVARFPSAFNIPTYILQPFSTAQVFIGFCRHLDVDCACKACGKIRL